jgi:hypothetical protein
MDFKMLSTIFASVFIAELGDKTQLATMLFASDKDTSKLTVFIGASLALVVTSAIGVMSKYLMNKLIHLVNMNEEAEKEYKARPREFVERWEKTETLKLEPEEREALATRDYGKLYALGAHPFTLWSFTEAVWVHERPREELVADYKAKAAKAGYPNFKT